MPKVSVVDGSTRLTGTDVVRYNNRLYSARWLNDLYGYFLVPISNYDENLGFWLPMSKCTLLKD